MTEAQKIAYKLGYRSDDPVKLEEIKDFILEAREFLRASGVPDENLDKREAVSFRSIWAEMRNKGDNRGIEGDPMLRHLLSHLRN